MTKHQLRLIKNHYLARWAVLRHNQKHSEKVLLLNDQFVLKNLLPGSTLCYECLGDVYQGVIPNLSTAVSDKKHNNLVLINNLEFKYKSFEELNVYLEDLAGKTLLPGGRVILSLSHRFLIYNRVEISVNTLLTTWIQGLKKFKLQTMANLLGRSQPGYGDYFFCLNYQ